VTAAAPLVVLDGARSVDAREACLRSLAFHSKSFALAGRLLPRDARLDVAALYAWCRRVDDAIDLTPAEQQVSTLSRLDREVDAVWGGRPSSAVPELWALSEVVAERGIPRHYASELLAGMRMDVEGTRYETLDDLLLYCHRVAGVVGLMMCHVLGVSDPRALRRAAHLGIAMQLTNICRDVVEDWGRGRLYLPESWLTAAGAPGLRAGGDISATTRVAMGRVVARLLREADRFYASGDRGLGALGLRAAFAVRAARLVYSAIGGRIARTGFDVFAGRAVVPRFQKLLACGRSLLYVALDLPRRALKPFRRAPELPIVRFPDDVVPL
jgi:phytoene synthase